MLDERRDAFGVERSEAMLPRIKELSCLVVDDDDVDRERLTRALRGTGLSLNCVEAGSVAEARSTLQEHRFDLAFLDQRLGDGEGTELIRALREADAGCQLIVVTGFSDPRRIVEAMRGGVYDYLTKDDLHEGLLRKTIDGALRSARLERELARAQDRLVRLSMYDALTGLPNRNLFFDRMDQQLSVARRGNSRFGLLLMDLDRFKEVNDELGHDVGDLVLAELGRRFASCVREVDTVARLGGDEFAVLLPGASVPEELATVADRLLVSGNEPLVVDGSVISVGVSVGGALWEESVTSDALRRAADGAMYAAKVSASGFALAESGKGTSSSRRLEVRARLPQALDRGELTLHYQAKVDLDTDAVVGVEALARWTNPTLGVVSPFELFTVAERTSYIAPLTWGLMEIALKAATRLRDAGWSIPVSVNLSGTLMGDRTLPARVQEALERHDLPGSALTLEITETALMASLAVARDVLEELREIGVDVALDDFGVGYTSLRSVRELAVTELKIDRTFVAKLSSNPRDEQIVRALATLAEGLGVRLVAEGIETQAVAERVRYLGCSVGQGYLMHRPAPLDELLEWLADR